MEISARMIPWIKLHPVLSYDLSQIEEFESKTNLTELEELKFIYPNVKSSEIFIQKLLAACLPLVHIVSIMNYHIFTNIQL